MMTELQRRFALATGSRAAALAGNANGTLIVTGDSNFISLNRGDAFWFHVLDQKVREVLASRAPASFYDGTPPNWVNIARAEDARRILYQDIRRFVEDPSLPAQRMALILGLAGEGKTTLLMRLAWDLAEAGYPVLWRHSGVAFSTPAVDFAEYDRPLIICFDQADEEKDLPALANDLTQFGIPYTILAASRHHEWRNAGLEPELRRAIYRLQPFAITRLQPDEVNDLLDRLDAAGKLDALADMPRERQVRHFLHRLEADGQLLPALLTARHGATSFEAIVESVLKKVRERFDNGSFLVEAYAVLASVHRFGYWLSRSLYARALGMDPADVGPRILRPLEGELLEMTEAYGERLYTRHPVIAERVLALAERNGWVRESRYLYAALFDTLGVCLRENPHLPECKLLTLLPLALKRVGDFAAARELFQKGTQADPSHAPVWQAWALMEKERGNIDKARELFQKGTQADPSHAPVWQAWALMEKERGNIDKARELFQKGTQADPTNAPTWQAWALMEKERGNIDKARELFQKGTQADPTNAPTWQAWALMEKERGNIDKARELFQKGTQADPTNAPTWQAWALMEKERGNIDKARELFQKGTQADPSHAPVWQAWALMEKERGNIDKARELFQKGTQADPSHAPVWQAWALMEKERGNIDKARELFQKGTQADPTNAPTWQAWALMELQLGPAGAVEMTERALQQARGDKALAALYCIQGRALARLKRFQVADAAFQQSLKLDSGNSHIHYFYASELLERQNRLQEACEHYSEALRLRPQKPRERENIRRALERLGCDKSRSANGG